MNSVTPMVKHTEPDKINTHTQTVVFLVFNVNIKRDVSQCCLVKHKKIVHS